MTYMIFSKGRAAMAGLDEFMENAIRRRVGSCSVSFLSLSAIVPKP